MSRVCLFAQTRDDEVAEPNAGRLEVLAHALSAHSDLIEVRHVSVSASTVH